MQGGTPEAGIILLDHQASEGLCPLNVIYLLLPTRFLLTPSSLAQARFRFREHREQSQREGGWGEDRNFTERTDSCQGLKI